MLSHFELLTLVDGDVLCGGGDGGGHVDGGSGDGGVRCERVRQHSYTSNTIYKI